MRAAASRLVLLITHIMIYYIMIITMMIIVITIINCYNDNYYYIYIYIYIYIPIISSSIITSGAAGRRDARRSGRDRSGSIPFPFSEFGDFRYPSRTSIFSLDETHHPLCAPIPRSVTLLEAHRSRGTPATAAAAAAPAAPAERNNNKPILYIYIYLCIYVCIYI